MRFQFLFELLVSTFFLQATGKTTELDKTTVRDIYEEETERIIRGKNAKPGMYPFAAALFFEDTYICSASIISPTTLLTAAHCVIINGVQLLPEELRAIAGNVNKSAAEVRVNFSEAITHPGYEAEMLYNDIAVLKTTRPLPTDGGNILPICLAKGDRRRLCLRAVAMGWGDTDKRTDVENQPDILQYAPQSIVSNRRCARTHGDDVNDVRRLCAVGLFRGICLGDSGGPLVCPGNRRKAAVQIGLASFINGEESCGTLMPAVFTRVSEYKDFILKAANDSSICFV